jgi:hypothetical protein
LIVVRNFGYHPARNKFPVWVPDCYDQSEPRRLVSADRRAAAKYIFEFMMGCFLAARLSVPLWPVPLGCHRQIPGTAIWVAPSKAELRYIAGGFQPRYPE